MRFPLLMVLLCSACWDFTALTRGGERPDGDDRLDGGDVDLLCRASPLRENCIDGIDNDGDCLVDCDDSECASGELCQRIPGLLGYGVFTRGGPPELCPVGTTLHGPPSLYDRIDDTQQACSGCLCGPITACVSELRIYSNNACSNNQLISPALSLTSTASSCVGLNDSYSQAKSAIVDPPRAVCQPDGTNARPNPAWSQTARLCRSDTASQHCTTPACILRELHDVRPCLATTESTCPSPFTVKQVWYRTYTDSRTCQCTCMGGAPACEGTVTLVEGMNCMASNKVGLTYGECRSTPSNFRPQWVDNGIKPKSGQSCTPSGTAQGRPMLSDPVTICCLPP
ncbi:MAG: hypothetical protein RMK29_18660 [Myxococcales bacterium]|nr:hypothetical protein [Myxococcota bacterium]MDW8283731.1 hypothetical protein [Myxococcales bacterium]